MGKVLLQGLALFIAGVVAVALNEGLGLGLGFLGFGLFVGGILGLVGDEVAFRRVMSFLLGVLTAIVVYVLRVLVLNESFLGQVAALAVLLGVLTVVSALFGGRVPLWSGLLGAVLVIGAYETTFESVPQNLLTDLFPTDSLANIPATALLPAALGYIAAVLVTGFRTRRPGEADQEPWQEPSETVSASKSEG